ncbi:MAG: cytochrome C [Flavobacteriales bacterium]|nr:MAG: cytochrome C [Flavobacteriales bacterium]
MEVYSSLQIQIESFISKRAIALLSFLFLSTFVFNSTEVFAEADGAKLFKQTCATCHSTSGKRGTGPGLEGFWDRIPGGDDEGKNAWLTNWVKNAGAIIKSKEDDYINKRYAEFNNYPMTPQPHLKDDEILAIAAYIKSKPHLVDGPDVGSKGTNPFIPVEEVTDNTTLYWLIILGIVFFIIINVMAGVKNNLQNLLNDKKGRPAVPDRGNLESVAYWIGTHKLHTALIILFLLVIGSVKGWYVLKDVGVYQGYAPEQPIKFSHKIHAGDNGIECVYCHHSAEKGKTAGIPSVNVCMNCHRGIDEGTWTKKEEISKIYAAAGWNPEKGVYDKPQKPIKWVRIHNLPDFVYFNHSQHVVAGKQECQTCHGQVQEMHLLEQHSLLTMGWCLDCHQETNVAMEGNAYYDKMHAELVEKHKDEGKTSFTVKDIGGFECAKCHY